MLASNRRCLQYSKAPLCNGLESRSHLSPILGTLELTSFIRPYIVESVTLRIGPARKKYFVSSSLLQNQTWIDSSRSRIELPDIDENTGHILVHYLYTGTYQTLDNIEESAVEDTHVEFRRAFSAYVMANTYQLAGLQQLAMHEIESFGRDMTVFDILAAIDEDFSRLPDSAISFEEYLMVKARNAFEKDHAVFLEDGTFDRINSVALSKILARCVMQLYKDKVTHMLRVEGSLCQSPEKYKAAPSMEANGVEVRSDSEVNDGKAQEQVPIEEASAHTGQALAVDEGNSFAQTGKKKKGKKGLRQDPNDEVLPFPEPQLVSEVEPLQDGIPPTLLEPEPVPEPEPVLVDDPRAFSLGAGSKGKNKKKKGAVEEPEPTPPEPELPAEPEPVPEPEPFKEDDRWGFEIAKKKTKKGESPWSEPLAEPEPPAEPGPVEEQQVSPAPELAKVEDPGGSWTALTIVPKKKKKKSASELPAEPAPVEEQQVLPAPEPASVEDPAGSSAAPSTTLKKKKKKDRMIVEPPPTPPGLELLSRIEPVQSDVPSPLPLTQEPSPVPEQVNGEAPSTIWGTTTLSLKKKKKKSKGIVEEAEVEKPLSPPPELNGEWKDDLSPPPKMVVANEGSGSLSNAVFSKKERKRLRKTLSDREQLRVEGQVAVDSAATNTGELASVAVGDLERTEGKVASSRKGAEVCPTLVEHFSESGGWRGCSTCRAWVGQANAELALTR